MIYFMTRWKYDNGETCYIPWLDTNNIGTRHCYMYSRYSKTVIPYLHFFLTEICPSFSVNKLPMKLNVLHSDDILFMKYIQDSGYSGTTMDVKMFSNCTYSSCKGITIFVGFIMFHFVHKIHSIRCLYLHF